MLISKLKATARLVEHLNYSQTRLPYPIVSVDHLNASALESVSALVSQNKINMS